MPAVSSSIRCEPLRAMLMHLLSSQKKRGRRIQCKSPQVIIGAIVVRKKGTDISVCGTFTCNFCSYQSFETENTAAGILCPVVIKKYLISFLLLLLLIFRL